MSQLYVAFQLVAVNGKVALRFALLDFQSITLPNSTRLPASPSDSRTVCTNFEPSASRLTSTATRTGPLSVMRTCAGPETYVRGGFCCSDQSMFQAGHCFGVSDLIARRIGVCSSSLFNFLSKIDATSPSLFKAILYRAFSKVESVTLSDDSVG